MVCITPKNKTIYFDLEEKESAKSLRLLAFAYKDNNIDNPEKDMVFLGLIGMMDPPRDSVSDARPTKNMCLILFINFSFSIFMLAN